MPRKGLSMRKISEVLRLAGQGLSYRQIGQSVGISPSTAHGYLERAQRAGVSWPLPDDLDAAALEERLFKRSEDELRPVRRTGACAGVPESSAPLPEQRPRSRPYPLADTAWQARRPSKNALPARGSRGSVAGHTSTLW